MSLFTTVRCIGGYIEYPLADIDGAEAAKIYHLDCVVDAGSLATLTVGTAFTNAAAAGVDVLPASVGPDANAFFVGQSRPEIFQGHLVRFSRQFATIPPTHDVFADLVVDMPKAFDDDTNDVLFAGGTFPINARYNRVYSRDISTFTRHKKFQVTFSGLEVTWVRDGTGATVPTRAQFYSTTERVAEITTIEKYMGDIYVAITPYIKPADVF